MVIETKVEEEEAQNTILSTEVWLWIEAIDI